jgi:hypothetical protein
MNKTTIDQAESVRHETGLILVASISLQRKRVSAAGTVPIADASHLKRNYCSGRPRATHFYATHALVAADLFRQAPFPSREVDDAA